MSGIQGRMLTNIVGNIVYYAVLAITGTAYQVAYVFCRPKPGIHEALHSLALLLAYLWVQLALLKYSYFRDEESRATSCLLGENEKLHDAWRGREKGKRFEYAKRLLIFEMLSTENSKLLTSL